jgi:hypothetical protein
MASMCHWLTLAAADRRSLAAVREFGAEVAPAEFPRLPEAHAGLQGWLVTSGGCSCSLLRSASREALADALTRARLEAGTLLAHRTFGDAPRGQRTLATQNRRDAASFLGDDDGVDRWVCITAAFGPDRPLPRTLDDGRVLAVAVDGPDELPLALFVVVVHPYTPGHTLLRSDREWNVLDRSWHEDEVAARREAAAIAGRPLRWREVVPAVE